MSSVIDQEKYGSRYVPNESKTASGRRKSIDVGDGVAQALRGKSVKDLKDIAKDNEIDVRKWADLNDGMFRMCFGNRVRAMVRNGQKVKVDGRILRSDAEGGAAPAEAKPKKAAKPKKVAKAKKAK